MRRFMTLLVRSIPRAVLALSFAACSPEEILDSPSPEPPGSHPELVPYALALEVDVSTARVRPVSALGNVASDTGLKQAFSLMGNAEVRPTIGNVTRGPAVNGRVAFRFDVTLTSLLNSGNLVTPTFPVPPAGVQGLLLIPFQIRDKQGPGTILEGPEWDGVPYNFFNDFNCTGTSGGNDCYPFKVFPAPLAPLASSAPQTVGFDIDSRVRAFTVLLILAADIQNTPLPPPASGAIAGRVTSPAAGALGGVTVTAGNRPPVTTDVAGGYQLTAVPVGEVSVRLSGLPAGCTDPGPRTAVVMAGGLATTDFGVTCPSPPATTGTVAGTVTSPTLGNLYGAIAVVNPGNRGGATDGAGAYAIPGVPAGQITVSLINLPAGCVNPGAQAATVVAGTSVAVNFSVSCSGAPSSGTLTGTLNGPGGALVGVEVTLQPGNLNTSSNRSGVFTFGELKPGTVLLTFAGFPIGCVNPGTQAVEIIAGRGAVLNLQVICASLGGIRGVIRDLDGSPVAGAEVVAEADGGTARTASGADGIYAFSGLAPGSYLVTARKPNVCGQGEVSVSVVAYQDANRDFALSCPSLIIVAVTVIPTSFTGGNFHVVDPLGNERLQAPVTLSPLRIRAIVPGAWRVTFSDLLPDCVTSGPAAVQAVQQQEIAANFTVICPSGLIGGTVSDLDGAAVGSAVVKFTRGGFETSVVTDPGGHYFSPDLVAGSWQVRVEKPGTCVAAMSGPLTVANGQVVAFSPGLDCPPVVSGSLIASFQGPLPSGLTVDFQPRQGPTVSVPVTGGTYTATLSPGEWFATVGGVPSNCAFFDVRLLTLAQQSQLTVDFSIDCTPATGLVVTPRFYDYGEVGVNVAKAASFTLTNYGSTLLGLTALSLTGDQSDFTPAGTTCGGGLGGVAIQPGASCTITLTFTPTVPGIRSATLTLTPSSGAPLSIVIRGTGVTGPARLMITPSSHDFGSVGVGASADMVFTLANTGPVSTGSLVPTIGGAHPGDFVPVGGLGNPASTCFAGLQLRLSPGQSCTITMRFVPQGTGPRSAQLSFTGQPGEAVSLALSGTGL